MSGLFVLEGRVWMVIFTAEMNRYPEGFGQATREMSGLLFGNLDRGCSDVYCAALLEVESLSREGD